VKKNKLHNDAGKAYLVQNHQLNQAKDASTLIASGIKKLNKTADQNQNELDELTASLEAILKSKGIDVSNLDDVEVSEDIEQFTAISQVERETIKQSTPEISIIETVNPNDTWSAYMSNVDDYMLKYELDTEVDPLVQLLPPEVAAKLLNDYKAQFGDKKWNKWDYCAVGLSALVAILTDIFIVRIPQDKMIDGKLHKGSPITKFFKGQSKKIMNPGEDGSQYHKWMHKAQQSMENYAKVPYDVSVNRDGNGLSEAIPGLSPKTHRLQSLGHDPILGFAVGVYDIMRGSLTGFGRNGAFMSVSNSNFQPTPNIIEAFIRQIAHLLSDIPTPQGVPAPFLGVLQSFESKSPFRLPQGNSGKLGEQVSYNDLSRYMYVNGYTIEHFVTMSLVPLIVELSIRTYYKLAYFDTLFPSRDVYNPKKDVKLQAMLTFGHTITMSGNVVKMWLNGWNPTAFNWAEMLVLIKSFYSLYKMNQERTKDIDQYLLDGWKSISANCVS